MDEEKEDEKVVGIKLSCFEFYHSAIVKPNLCVVLLLFFVGQIKVVIRRPQF